MSRGEDAAGYEEQPLPDDWQSQLRKLVLSYLIHNCYQDTAMCLSESVNKSLHNSESARTTSMAVNSGSVKAAQENNSESQDSLSELDQARSFDSKAPTAMDVETNDGMLESLANRKRTYYYMSRCLHWLYIVGHQCYRVS